MRVFAYIVQLRACLHEGGGPQVGEVTWGGLPHLTCKRDHIKMRDYMDRRATPPKRVTSPTWGPLPPCKQALNYVSCNVKVDSLTFISFQENYQAAEMYFHSYHVIPLNKKICNYFVN